MLFHGNVHDNDDDDVDNDVFDDDDNDVDIVDDVVLGIISGNSLVIVFEFNEVH